MSDKTSKLFEKSLNQLYSKNIIEKNPLFFVDDNNILMDDKNSILSINDLDFFADDEYGFTSENTKSYSFVETNNISVFDNTSSDYSSLDSIKNTKITRSNSYNNLLSLNSNFNLRINEIQRSDSCLLIK